MILYLDVGNSRIKYALEQGDAPVEYGFLSSLTNLDFAVSKVIVASVRTATATSELLTPLKAIGVPCFEAIVEDGPRLVCDYEHPGSLGVDRWLAALAAYHFFGDSIVADAGTALTVDLVSGGHYRGGVIVQGIKRSVDSLLSGTDLVNEVSFSNLPHVPVNTGHAVGLGALTQASSLIEQLRRRWGGSLPLILTGGDAPLILPVIGAEAIYAPNLVFDGLKLSALKEIT